MKIMMMMPMIRLLMSLLMMMMMHVLLRMVDVILHHAISSYSPFPFPVSFASLLLLLLLLLFINPRSPFLAPRVSARQCHFTCAALYVTLLLLTLLWSCRLATW